MNMSDSILISEILTHRRRGLLGVDHGPKLTKSGLFPEIRHRNGGYDAGF